MKIINKPVLKLIIISLLFFLFSDCGSSKEINELSSQINCQKRIYFVWDDESNYAKYSKNGNFNNLVKRKNLNIKDLFISTIKRLNKKHEGEYIYSEYIGFPSDSVIYVKVKLEKVNWNMGFSKTIADMQMSFSTNEKELKLIGRSNGYSGEKCYLKSFEDATLQFIIANCGN
ncbi:hypothetical protein [uncultured Psychroserpens sp.]|uniref:hypothetical protein n=1 Tax=uncultured Psychroserpens sp. TaxID=255436 RepID=UPI002633EB35|nr:hypothetical protein [uncultured Psychroserpens sp.]